MGRVVEVHPITRLERHGKIAIFLDEGGDVRDAYFQVVEFRGFERFCRGRPVEEMPLITSRICGVCPWAHHMAAAKAGDAVYGITPPTTGVKLRELAYNVFFVHDHSAIFYALSAPDFILGPKAPKEKRNVVGMVEKLGAALVKNVLSVRLEATRILETLGGRAVHPSMAVPGGVSKGISKEDRKAVEEGCKKLLEFAKSTLQIFEDIVLKNEEYLELIKGDIYYHKTYYIGLVDKDMKVNYYDGLLRIVDPEGREKALFEAKDYLNYIGEHTEPWTYLKFPFLKQVGWTGIKEGVKSGVYRVGPLARLNVSEGFSTPLAQEAYKTFMSALGKPVHATLAYHWARVIETLNAAERALELAQDPEITKGEFREVCGKAIGVGVGVVEAPRGVLIHHYKTDEDGILKDINLIVGTVHNNAGINLSVKKAAERLIKNGKVDDGLLNMVEMAFRAYDPCLACGTHSLPGSLPLELEIYDHEGKLVKKLKQPS